MSLDVYLTGPKRLVRGTGVFIRENGSQRELNPEEVAARWPDAEVSEQCYETEELYSANITHNLNTMTAEAGLYEPLWRPDEHGITTARQLIEPLTRGLKLLCAEPDRFRAFNPAFNPKNGWGDYEGLVRFVTEYLAACHENPDATVRVSR